MDEKGAKYLAVPVKTGTPGMFEGKRLWAAFGAFAHCKVKDVEVESKFTEAVKFCQQELQQSKLPFLFVNALQCYSTRDPIKLKMACHFFTTSGVYIADIMRMLRECSVLNRPSWELVSRSTRLAGFSVFSQL